jgi:hypothetical protein
MLRQFNVCQQCYNNFKGDDEESELLDDYMEICAMQTMTGYSYLHVECEPEKAQVVRFLEQMGYLITCDSLYSADMVRVKAKGIFDPEENCLVFCR